MATSTDSLPLPAVITRMPEGRKRRLVQILTGLFIILVWEIIGRILGPIFLAPFSSVVEIYIELATEGDMVSELIGTVQEMLIGFVAMVIFAVPVGLAMGRSIIAEKSLEPWVSAFFVTSTSAMLPLLIVMFGTGLTFRIAIIWLAGVWHILLNIYHGAKGVDQEYIDVGHSFDASSYKMFKSITLPATAPFLASGLRMGIARALRGIILAETYIIVGYGGLIRVWGRQSASTAPVLALILTIMILAFTMRRGLEMIQDRYIPWAETSTAL